MTVIARFPVSLIRTSLRYTKNGAYDARNDDRFGYKRARCMRSSVIYSEKDLSYVHCGCRPLKAIATIACFAKIGMISGTCYFDDLGNQVYPS